MSSKLSCKCKSCMDKAKPYTRGVYWILRVIAVVVVMMIGFALISQANTFAVIGGIVLVTLVVIYVLRHVIKISNKLIKECKKDV